jgi:hypothetical protein
LRWAALAIEWADAEIHPPEANPRG